MKTLIILFTLSFQFVISQTVVDMATSHNVDWDRKNGQYYLKDVNNYFNDFEGTWIYEYDTNKEFRIIITKVEMFHIQKSWGTNYYKDGLKIKYEKYENGNLIFQSTLRNYPSGITKIYGHVALTFFDYGRLGAGFDADLSLIQEDTQSGNSVIKLHFLLDKFEAINPYHEDHPSESFFSVPNDIIMTRL